MKKYMFDHPQENKHGWFVAVKGDPFSYLHDDLQVKNSTDGGGESSGYFPTKHDAYIAIGKFGRRQMEQANGSGKR